MRVYTCQIRFNGVWGAMWVCLHSQNWLFLQIYTLILLDITYDYSIWIQQFIEAHTRLAPNKNIYIHETFVSSGRNLVHLWFIIVLLNKRHTIISECFVSTADKKSDKIIITLKHTTCMQRMPATNKALYLPN